LGVGEMRGPGNLGLVGSHFAEDAVLRVEGVDAKPGRLPLQATRRVLESARRNGMGAGHFGAKEPAGRAIADPSEANRGIDRAVGDRVEVDAGSSLPETQAGRQRGRCQSKRAVAQEFASIHPRFLLALARRDMLPDMRLRSIIRRAAIVGSAGSPDGRDRVPGTAKSRDRMSRLSSSYRAP